jgi:DNA polymerase-3 subunit beta
MALEQTSPEGEELEDIPAPELDASHDSLAFETKAFALRALLEKASSVLPSKDIMPVLKNFQVEVGEDRVRVVATDLDLSVIVSTPMIQVKKSGTAVFPGKRMLQIMQEAPQDADLLLDVNDGVATIAVGKTQWTLRLVDGSTYPDMPDTSAVEFHSVDRVRFLGAISACRYAAGNDMVRPNLMMIDLAERKMTACDGVRVQQVDLGKDWPDELTIQIPTAAVDDLVKQMRSTQGELVDIASSDHHLVFRVGSDVFICAKLMATFPDVADLLLRPALANDKELDVDRAELVDAIKRVRITADPETSAIQLALTTDTVTVRSRDKFGNEAVEAVQANWLYEQRTLVVNHEFLTDMLAMADVRSCQFFLGEDQKSRKSPIMLRDSETGMVGLINQMRQDWTTD